MPTKEYLNEGHHTIVVGSTVVIHAWGKFAEKSMRCVALNYDEKYKTYRYVFDNGIEWTESNLQSNFTLWEGRNGYHIIEPTGEGESTDGKG